MTGYTARSRRGTAEAVRSALHDFSDVWTPFCLSARWY